MVTCINFGFQIDLSEENCMISVGLLVNLATAAPREVTLFAVLVSCECSRYHFLRLLNCEITSGRLLQIVITDSYSMYYPKL